MNTYQPLDLQVYIQAAAELSGTGEVFLGGEWGNVGGRSESNWSPNRKTLGSHIQVFKFGRKPQLVSRCVP
jgi:hypothetical protein